MAAAPKTTVYDTNGIPFTATSASKAGDLAARKGAAGSVTTVAPPGIPNTSSNTTATAEAQKAFQAGQQNAATMGGTTPQTGTLTAQITQPKGLTKPVAPPAVVTGDAAEKDLANKKMQMDQLTADTIAHQQALNTPQTTPEQTDTSKTDTSTPQAPQSLDEQITTLLGGLNSSDENIDQDTQTQLTPLQQQQQELQTQLDKAATNALTQLKQISSGTYPLSSSEQSLLSSTKDTYVATIQAQQTANSAFEGSIAATMASLGISTSAPTEALGEMHAAISAGNGKIADLNAQMATSLANLQIGFQKSDYTMISDSWDKTSTYMQSRIKTLQDMQTQVLDAAKQQKQDAKDYTTTALQYVVASAQFTETQKQNAIQNAFSQQQITESQRHNMAEESIAWTNANKHNYQLSDDGTIFDSTTGSVVAAPDAVARGVVSTTDPNGSDINQAIANAAASNKLSAPTQTSIGPILGVINAAKAMADNNPGGKFGGINPLNVVNDSSIFGIGLPFRQASMSNAGVQNRGAINGINLKVQQWASGASLTTAQTKQVETMVPTVTDTDAKVAEKLNNLTNFMNQQMKATLATSAVQYNPVEVDLYGKGSDQEKSLNDIFNAPEDKSKFSSAVGRGVGQAFLGPIGGIVGSELGK